MQITCEASPAPPHAHRTRSLLTKLDTRCKMNPPLRTESDRQALIEGLRDGTVDCIATDHAPHAREEKEVPFEQAPMGTTGLETSFAAVYTDLVLPGVLDLGLVVDKLSSGAACLDLPLPRIEVGEPANLCLIDLEAEWEVGEAGYESRSENSCFAGRTLKGRVAGHDRGGLGRLPGAGVRGERGMSMQSGYVLLEDGTVFEGDLLGGETTGEVVFTTGMSGYQESVTDPSFNSQIVTFTYPHIGNYGVSEAAMESDRIHARAVIMRAAMNGSDAPSAHRAGSTGSASTPFPRSPASTPGHWSATSATPAR